MCCSQAPFANKARPHTCGRMRPWCKPIWERPSRSEIICIGSMMSVFASSYAAPYSASKGGIVQLARSLAVAWAKDKIQVNSILPGWIDTDLTRRARREVPGLHERDLRVEPGASRRLRHSSAARG